MSREKSTATDQPTATTDEQMKRESAAETRRRVDEVLAFLTEGDAPAFIKTAMRDAIAEAARRAGYWIDFSEPEKKQQARLYRIFRYWRPAFELRATGYVNAADPDEVRDQRERNHDALKEAFTGQEPDEQLSRLRAQLANLEQLPEYETVQFQLKKQIAQLEREQASATDDGDEWAGFDIIEE